MKKENILYLLEMGMNDEKITTDIKNHRVRVLENIDIKYCGKKYNMFFEFTQGTHRTYRTTNKRTGAPLKKAVEEIILKDGIYIDTEFEKEEKKPDGSTWKSSWRNSKLEREIWEEHHNYTRKDILEIINKLKIGKPYTNVILVEEEAARIIETTGEPQEREIIKKRDFQTEGDHYFTIIKWESDCKIVAAIQQEWEPTKDGRQLADTKMCLIDMINSKIIR